MNRKSLITETPRYSWRLPFPMVESRHSADRQRGCRGTGTTALPSLIILGNPHPVA